MHVFAIFQHPEIEHHPGIERVRYISEETACVVVIKKLSGFVSLFFYTIAKPFGNFLTIYI